MNLIKITIATTALLFSSFALADNWQGQPNPEANGTSMKKGTLSQMNSNTTKSSTSKSQIKEAQTALNDKGYKIGVDGIAGTQTTTALKKFQRDNDLTTDGQFNTETMEALGIASTTPSDMDQTRRPASVESKNKLDSEVDDSNFKDKYNDNEMDNTDVYPNNDDIDEPMDENSDLTY